MPNPIDRDHQLRFLLYSHDGLGLGHTRRNLALAGALADLAPEASVLLATGVDEVGLLGVPPNVGVLKLPGLRKVTNGYYASRHLPLPEADITKLRSALLTAAVQSFRPAVMLVDKHPAGVKGELRQALEALRAMGGRAALGLRDILDDRTTVVKEWAEYGLTELIAEYHDRVLVYGDSCVLDPIEAYDFPAVVAYRTRFCGYVVERPSPNGATSERSPTFERQPRTRPVVLVTPGGGEDGYALIETFIRAASGAPWDGVVVTGPQAPAEHRARLHGLAREVGVESHWFVPALSEWFGLADALVCMGGYNTIAEAISRGTPTVCVPRTRPRAEQLIRARSLARLGLLSIVEPQQLTPDALRQKIEAALQQSRKELLDRTGSLLRFDGARRAAVYLLELADGSRDQSPVLAESVAR